MMDISDEEVNYESLIQRYMGKAEITQKIQDMINNNSKLLELDIDSIREFDQRLANVLLNNPLKWKNHMEIHLNDLINEMNDSDLKRSAREISNIKKQEEYRVNLTGSFGKHMVSPRGLTADLANKFVCVQGIVTRMSIVRPKLVNSVHYCEDTKQGSVKEYFDQYSTSSNPNIEGNSISGKATGYMTNAVPTKDLNGNPLSFEYGLSKFRDIQILHVQEPPERTPVGQLPRSIEVVLQDDLVDKVKPGDRVQITGIFKCIPTQSTAINGNFRLVILTSNISSLTAEAEIPRLTGDDIRNIKELSQRADAFDVLSNSVAPSIYGHQYVKKALILQLLGGSEKNLENGTHLRGDINVLLIGDPSTAKSQFLRHMLNLAPNAINTTGRGSSGVGLTAAVVVDRDTGERHLEAGAMVLGDKGVVCIDEFDKMSELDRVAIHEVMEQQTVTIAKAGIHVSLNARCSVLAAANPIYGEYQKSLPAAKNIGLPDSLLSRFDLVFVVLDENDSELDRLIADRVIRNHMFPSEIPTIMNVYDEKIIEPDINAEEGNENNVYEKFNELLHGKNKRDILNRNFLKKYLHYAKKSINPTLSEEAATYISLAWTKLRSNNDEEWESYRAVPITVRTLETLIRLATAHAKIRLSKAITKKDCEIALEMLTYALYNETGKEEDSEALNDVEIESESENKPSKKNASKKAEKAKTQIKQASDDESSLEAPRNNIVAPSAKKKQMKRESPDEEVDNIFKMEPSTNEASQQQSKFTYKIIYDNTKNREFSQIHIDELWTLVSKNKDFSKHNIKNKSDLLNIVTALDLQGKCLYSETDKNITLI